MNIKSLRNSLSTPGQTKSLDGLRAIAILLVLITHICQRIPGVSFVRWNTEWATPLYNGWIGVDLFFVLSGYLIASAVCKEINNNTFSMINFYLRRAFRILPAYFFVILVIVLMSHFLPQQAHSILPAFNMKDVAANILLFTDYRTSEIGIPSWSLSIEEHFYLLLPLFLLLFRKVNTRVYAAVALIFLALIFRMMTYRAYSIGEATPIDAVISLLYTPFHNRMDALAIGVLIALVNTQVETTPLFRFLATCIGFLLAGFIFISGALKGGFYETTIQYTLVCLGFGGLLWGALGNNKFQAWLSSRLWVPVARISYSVYLTHLLVLAVLCHFITLKLWMFIPVLAVCLLAAVPLFLLVEYPCHRFARKRFVAKRADVEKVNTLGLATES